MLYDILQFEEVWGLKLVKDDLIQFLTDDTFICAIYCDDTVYTIKYTFVYNKMYVTFILFIINCC